EQPVSLVAREPADLGERGPVDVAARRRAAAGGRRSPPQRWPAMRRPQHDGADGLDQRTTDSTAAARQVHRDGVPSGEQLRPVPADGAQELRSAVPAAARPGTFPPMQVTLPDGTPLELTDGATGADAARAIGEG